MSYAPLDLKGKVAVVIGGTSGIGRAIAHGLAQAGADVIPTSRRAEQVEVAAGEIESLGRRSLRLASDVADRPSLQNVLAEAVKAFGKVDILVNSAGRTKRAPTINFSDDDWNAILDTNLTGTLRACQIFGRHMIERQYGRIINIASLSTFVALHEVAAYSASKAAVAFIKRGWSVNKSRKVAMLVCAIAVIPIIFAAHATNLWAAVGFVSLAAAAHQGWSANIFTMASDMFPRRAVGSVVGIGGMAGSIGGMLIQSTVGLILYYTSSYLPIFIIAASTYLVALGIIHLLAPRLEPANLESVPA